MEATHAADTEFLVKKSMSSGYRLFSVLTPPVYTAFVLMQRGRGAFSVNRLLRATWLGGAVGTVAGGGLEYARSAYSNADTVRTRRIELAYNITTIRAEDHSTIGALLFALLTPAIFWKRARTVHLILGGAGIGSAIGSGVHIAKLLSGDRPPQVAVPTAPVTADP
ncbi:hypothetical protein EYR40_001212 [Pleurotus pulmonarius]|nr:hypothetical protein EYR36_000443 [Pleurotus pulmonarius]KAF4604029.1 hypothetical protein EYR38_004451 [Pleurotus pulmonarius]KAF4608859.1 hypothetical protein EYR40_001212 [Pleurotus pulmonarius]